MGLSFARGKLTWATTDSVSATHVVSGLSFAPVALRLYTSGYSGSGNAGANDNARMCMGFAVSTSLRRSVGSYSAHGTAAADCATIVRDDCVICQVNGSAADAGRLDVSAFASDGFTLIVDVACAQTVDVYWEAWGGSDITVATIGDITEPAATGAVDYTVTGFVAAATDQVVMFAGCQSTAALNTGLAGDSGFCVGFGGGAALGNYVVSENSDDASATMDTDVYGSSNACIAMIAVAGGTAAARASLTQFGTDNFRLNWANRITTGRRSVFLAIQGGLWDVGAYTIDGSTTNATATVSGLTYQPIGLSLIGTQGAAQTTTAATTAALTIGAAASISDRGGVAIRDLNGAANATVEVGCCESAVIFSFGGSGAPSCLYDLDSINTDGFTMIVDQADAGASTVVSHGYMAFAGVSGGITVSITGVAGSGSAGDPSISGKASVPITGAEGTGAPGTVAVSMPVSLVLSGVAGSGAAGDPAISGRASLALAGVGGAGAPGDLAPSGAANAPVTGAEGQGVAGMVVIVTGILVAVNGVEATGSSGDPAISGKANVPVTGVEGTGAAGEATVTGGIQVALNGVEGSGQAGTPTVSGKTTAILTGADSTGSPGVVTVALAVSVTLAGVAGSGAAGDPAVTGQANVPLAGVSGAGAVGDLVGSAGTQVLISGVEGAAAAGDLTVISGVQVLLPGVTASGAPGLLEVTGTANVPLTGAEAQGLVGLLVALVGTIEAPPGRTIVVDGQSRTIRMDTGSRVIAVELQSRIIKLN